MVISYMLKKLIFYDDIGNIISNSFVINSNMDKIEQQAL